MRLSIGANLCQLPEVSIIFLFRRPSRINHHEDYFPFILNQEGNLSNDQKETGEQNSQSLCIKGELIRFMEIFAAFG